MKKKPAVQQNISNLLDTMHTNMESVLTKPVLNQVKREFKNIKVPQRLKAIAKLMKSGDQRAATRGMSDLGDILDKFDKRLDNKK